MKIKATREVKKTEEFEVNFTLPDAFLLLADYLSRKNSDALYSTTWNGLTVDIDVYDENGNRYTFWFYNEGTNTPVGNCSLTGHFTLSSA